MSCPGYNPGLKLCQRGYCSAKAKYKKYPSAYANLYASAVCKGQQPDQDGLVQADPDYMDRLEHENKDDNALRRWLDEEWVNVCEKLPNGKYRPCGNREESKFPYCRPLHRISSSTPRTVDEFSQDQLEDLCRIKRSLNPEEGQEPKRISSSLADSETD